MKKILVFFLFMLLMPNVCATGISISGQYLAYYIDFKPNEEFTFAFKIKVFNSEASNISIYVQDSSNDTDGTYSNISKYFWLSNDRFTLKGGEYAMLTVNIRLPEVIEEPGTHEVTIGAVEVKSNSEMIGGITSVGIPFTIRVPYKGQYLVHSLNVKNVNQGDPIPVEIAVRNLGTEDINRLYSDVTLRNLNGSLISTKQTSLIALKSQEKETLPVAIPTVRIYSGRYLVNSTIHYDGKLAFDGREVRIGDLDLKIINQTNEAISGKINEIFVDIESNWAETIKNIYAGINIGKFPYFKTVSGNIDGFKRTRLKGFFDAQKVEPGIYDMIITAYFENKTVAKTTQIVVTKGRLEFPMSISITNLIFTIVILIVLMINIILFLLLMKKKDEHEKEK